MDTWIFQLFQNPDSGQPKKLGYPSIRISNYPDTTSLGNTDRAKWRDRWYVNDDGIRLHGNNAYGYYDWFAPEEGEEGYILAKHEGE